MQNIKRNKSCINFDTEGHRYALVVARFNQAITQRLLDGALDGLKEYGVRDEAIKVAWVPGAFEIPLIAKKMAESKKYEAVICLGAVIRGETAHFDYVAGQAASGILNASLETSIPVIFSVLATETLLQAENRSGKKEANSGYTGALSAIEMVNLLRNL